MSVLLLVSKIHSLAYMAMTAETHGQQTDVHQPTQNKDLQTTSLTVTAANQKPV